MTEQTRSDLCSRCVYAADCAAQKKSSGPVLCCDRFLRLNGADPGGISAACPAPAAGSRGKAAGLCLTCSRKERCIRGHAEGGVWRCADYV